jgi:arylsulfatase A
VFKLRTTVGRVLGLLILVGPRVLLASELPASAVSSPPNIILMIGDDVAWTDFGFMGSKVVRTPHLDRLAETGTVFTHAFAPHSVCGPVLRSLLTGMRPQAVARGIAAASQPRRPVPTLRDVFETLPELLGRRGYASFQGGKFFEGGFETGGFTHGMTVDRTAEGRGAGPPRRGAAAVVRGTGGRSLGRETMQPLWDFLSANREGPFFVWYAPMLPHVPFDAPEKFTRLYAQDPPLLRGYRANMTRFDATVGQLLARLKSLGIRERTLVVYVSDNGWDTAVRGKIPGLGGPKGKGSLYELGGTHAARCLAAGGDRRGPA